MNSGSSLLVEDLRGSYSLGSPAHTRCSRFGLCYQTPLEATFFYGRGQRMTDSRDILTTHVCSLAKLLAGDNS